MADDFPLGFFGDATLTGPSGFVRGGGIGATVVPLTAKHWRLNATRAEDEVFDALQLEMGRFVLKMSVYPPPKPAPSKYRRTNTLLSGWHVSYRRGIAIDLYNDTAYAAFVYGNNEGEIQQGPPWLAQGWPNMYREFQKVKPLFVAHAQANLSKWALEGGT